MKTLLSHRILETLTLNRDAPFPSEIRDGHDLVRKWRHEQRLRLVRDIHSRSADNDCDFPDNGSPEE